MRAAMGTAGTGGLLLVILPFVLVTLPRPPSLSTPDAFAPNGWVSPPLLQNESKTPGVVELDLTASPTRLELLPGKPTDAWAYNGMVPGPTIELREGDRVTIH